MIIFEKVPSGYDVYYTVNDEAQYLGEIKESELEELVRYYKDFGNEVRIDGRIS